MTFEGRGLRVVIPLDLSQGERYTEPLRNEDPDVLDHIYNITAEEDDYEESLAEDWESSSSCMTDSEDGLEIWKHRLSELHGHRCTRITKSLRWLSSQTRTFPASDASTAPGASTVPLSEQTLPPQQLQTLDSALQFATARRWISHHEYLPCR